MSAGLRAYHNREWTTALSTFGQISKGGFSRKDQAKASEYAAAVKEVAEGINGAGSAGNPAKAAKLWHRAYKADRRIDGHHVPFLVKKLTEAYVAAAKQYYNARRYAEASEAAKEAMNFDPENTEAMGIDDKCREAAKRMLKEAEAQLAQGSNASARDKARQVMKILGMMDPDAQKAGEIARKAQEASMGGDED
jgi:tetratricopeptide (TPR) repeat protein